jgi:hypothetical protein
MTGLPGRFIEMKNIWFIVLFCLAGFHGISQNSPAPGDERTVVVLAVEGTAFFSESGAIANTPLKVGQVLRQGAVVRAGRRSKVDIFLRQIGTTIRLMPMTLLRFEKLEKHLIDGVVVKTTLLDLERGEIFCYVRVLVPESSFEVKNRTGLATVPGAGQARYKIGADGTFYVGAKSQQPLNVKQMQNATALIIKPGEVFKMETKRVAPMKAAELEEMLHNLDELQNLALYLTPKPSPNELPRN